MAGVAVTVKHTDRPGSDGEPVARLWVNLGCPSSESLLHFKARFCGSGSCQVKGDRVHGRYGGQRDLGTCLWGLGSPFQATLVPAGKPDPLPFCWEVGLGWEWGAREES